MIKLKDLITEEVFSPAKIATMIRSLKTDSKFREEVNNTIKALKANPEFAKGLVGLNEAHWESVKKPISMKTTLSWVMLAMVLVGLGYGAKYVINKTAEDARKITPEVAKAMEEFNRDKESVFGVIQKSSHPRDLTQVVQKTPLTDLPTLPIFVSPETAKHFDDIKIMGYLQKYLTGKEFWSIFTGNSRSAKFNLNLTESQLSFDSGQLGANSTITYRATIVLSDESGVKGTFSATYTVRAKGLINAQNYVKIAVDTVIANLYKQIKPLIIQKSMRRDSLAKK